MESGNPSDQKGFLVFNVECVLCAAWAAMDFDEEISINRIGKTINSEIANERANLYIIIGKTAAQRQANTI